MTMPGFEDIVRRWADTVTRRSMHDTHQFIKERGLSMPQLTTLMRLYHQGSCAISDISQHLGVSAAASSQMIDRMVQQELIERVEDPDDRRVRSISLTGEGHALVLQFIATRHPWIPATSQAFSEEQKTKLAEALILMTKFLENLHTHPESKHPQAFETQKFSIKE